MNCKFYTLLYLDPEEKKCMSGRTLTSERRIDVFVKNACMLDKSLEWTFMLNDANGFENKLTVLTNNRPMVEEALKRIGYDRLNIEEIKFTLNVPRGIPFYSAHYKIDAFRYLSTMPDSQYSILLDNDVIASGYPNQELCNIIRSGKPICYVLPNYGGENDRKITDIHKISPSIIACEWIGGELLGGVNSLYSTLYDHCNRISPSYFSHVNSNLFHVGDEFLTSLALAKIREEGLSLFNAGALNGIYRYWGVMERKSPEKYKVAFLHLPSDKFWTASLPLQKINNGADWLKRYKRHRIGLFFKRIVKKFIYR